MFRTLFLLFIILPIIEIALLMEIGSLLGFWTTLGIIVLTAWVGAKKVREQGIATMHSVQEKMNQGEMPSDEIVAGLMLLVSGVLLVTPGFVTDIIGLTLLVPAARSAIAKAVKKHIKVAPMQGMHSQQSFYYQQSHFNQGNDFEQARTNDADTIEGEYERKD